MSKNRRPTRVAMALLLAGAAAGAAAEERLSLEWIWSDEGKSAASLPDRAWLNDGIVLLYDHHPAPADRTLEVYDPATRARRRLVDPAVATRSLSELPQVATPPAELGWPDALDPGGRWAAYERGGRVFLLDLHASTFQAVGDSSQRETSPRFSPDGRSLAFVRDHDLHLRDTESGAVRRLTTDGTETRLNGTLSWVYWEEIFGREDLGYWFSPDSRRIAYLQTDESRVDRATFVDFEPALPRVIHQRYPKAGGANPKVRAGILDMGSGETTWVDLGGEAYEYLVRVQWLPDGRRLALQTLDRSQTRLDLYVADAATGAARRVLRETDPAWVNVHDDLVFFADGERFLWVSERDGHAHVYLYATDGTLIRQVTRGDWALRASADVEGRRQAIARLDEANGWLYFTALERSPLEKHLYRIRLDGSGMERLTRVEGTHLVAFGPDGRSFLDASSAIGRLPALTLHAPGGESVATVAEPRPDLLERFALLPRELTAIPARDGFPLPAMLLRPRGFDPARRYPVVIYVYGGPSAPTVADRWAGRAGDYYEQILADEGYLVVRVDNRLSTAQSKSLENLVVSAGYGETELADLVDAVAWLRSQPFVDPARIGIWGWSGGGCTTLLGMTGSTAFRAGIAVAPVTDFRYYDTKWAESIMGRPQDAPARYERASLARRAARLHGRLLLVYGSYDDNVHPQNAERFADELIEAGITFEMMIYPMRKHAIADDAAQRHLYRTMLEFWKRSL